MDFWVWGENPPLTVTDLSPCCVFVSCHSFHLKIIFLYWKRKSGESQYLRLHGYFDLLSDIFRLLTRSLTWRCLRETKQDSCLTIFLFPRYVELPFTRNLCQWYLNYESVLSLKQELDQTYNIAKTILYYFQNCHRLCLCHGCHLAFLCCSWL